MGFDGAVGWTKTPEQGLREEVGQQLDFIRSEAEFYKELKLRERYSKLTLLGLAQSDNREAYVIEAEPQRGQPEKLYFDCQTGLLVRIDLVPNLGQEKMRMQMYFEDYRAVDGVKLPFAIRRAPRASPGPINSTRSNSMLRWMTPDSTSPPRHNRPQQAADGFCLSTLPVQNDL